MNKLLKKVLVLTLMIAMVFSIAACGGDESTDDENGGGTEAVTYKAVTEATFPPFDTVDEDGNIIGFDMDLMNAIAEDQGFKVEYVDMEFDSLIPAVENGAYE